MLSVQITSQESALTATTLRQQLTRESTCRQRKRPIFGVKTNWWKKTEEELQKQHSLSSQAVRGAAPFRKTANSIMSSIPARLMGKPSPKGEQSTLTLTLAMLFFLISKQMGKQSNSLLVALMKLLFRLLVDYLGGSAVSYFLKIWGTF